MATRLAHVLSISGGKDSTALWLESIERGVEAVRVFADTGHEHPETYTYVDYLERALGTITRVKADFGPDIARKRETVQTKWRAEGISEARIEQALAVLKPTGIPFLDLCLMKGRFPSTRRRFCSSDLKHVPIRRQVIDPLLDDGYTVVCWQGVRADESLFRSGLDVVEEVEPDLITYRPIITWTVEEVFAIHRRHGIKPNPLYRLGMGRVGCMPCIHARKDELREIAARFPVEVERVVEWERLVGDASKRGSSSFFSSDKTPGDHVGNIDIPMPGILDVVAWSKTGLGGRQYDFLRMEDPVSCSSQYGLCE